MFDSDTNIGKIKIGHSGIKVSRMGFGCMAMSEFYGPPKRDKDSEWLLMEAVDRGINFFDTADMYGRGHNEKLIGKTFKNIRSQVVIATKFGVVRDPVDPAFFGLNGRPEYVVQACEKSLRRLKTDYIDLYLYHRMDPTTPIEDTIGAMSQLVSEGKVRSIGLSKSSPEAIQRANGIHPLAALQSEFSLWARNVEKEILPLCQNLGISFISYSPLGRGYLTGKIKKRNDLHAGDYRLGNPNFSEKELEKNQIYVERLLEVAKKQNATIAQIALAWLLNKENNIIPIPGTRHSERLIENLGALKIELTLDEIRFLDQSLINTADK